MESKRVSKGKDTGENSRMRVKKRRQARKVEAEGGKDKTELDTEGRWKQTRKSARI